MFWRRCPRNVQEEISGRDVHEKMLEMPRNRCPGRHFRKEMYRKRCTLYSKKFQEEMSRKEVYIQEKMSRKKFQVDMSRKRCLHSLVKQKEMSRQKFHEEMFRKRCLHSLVRQKEMSRKICLLRSSLWVLLYTGLGSSSSVFCVNSWFFVSERAIRSEKQTIRSFILFLKSDLSESLTVALL